MRIKLFSFTQFARARLCNAARSVFLSSGKAGKRGGRKENWHSPRPLVDPLEKFNANYLARGSRVYLRSARFSSYVRQDFHFCRIERRPSDRFLPRARTFPSVSTLFFPSFYRNTSASCLRHPFDESLQKRGRGREEERARVQRLILLASRVAKRSCPTLHSFRRSCGEWYAHKIRLIRVEMEITRRNYPNIFPRCGRFDSCAFVFLAARQTSRFAVPRCLSLSPSLAVR